MNSLTKQRYISTSIWSDDWFDSLSEREKLIYFYLLTNEHTNAAGVYQCTLKNVRLETGLGREDVERIMAKFEAEGKAFYYCEYIIIPKWLKHQKIKERSGIFLGALKVLKSLPDEVKIFISDRSHYDFDVSPYIGTPPRPPQDPLKTHPPKTGDPPQTSPRPSQDPPPENGGPPPDLPPENGEYPPKNTLQNPHDLDLDLDLDLEFNINTHIQSDGDPLKTHPPKTGDPPPDFPEFPDALPSYFIQRWQQNADIFNCLASIKRPANWKAFWEQNTMTREQIDIAIDNFIEGVKTGAIERRFIPSSPDGFVINGWIARSLSRFKKQGQRISNDNAPDDINQYFREV